MSQTNIGAVVWPAQEPIDEIRILDGQPQASTLILHRDSLAELGLWRISTGVFTTIHQGYTEFFTIIEGRGQLIRDTGAIIELRPETVVVLEDGWTGRWVVDQPIVKSYAIIPTQGMKGSGE